ncbi:MAG TPA: protoporphyrinogen oxidase [Terriglobia bacterium]|nr:protoporphyrinogen oxidase [Terriglobia bacterium]
MKPGPDVVVIGAGISGLTCAYRLQKLGFDVLVLESSDRAGGVIRSEQIQGHLVEWGPGSLLPTEHTFGILEELGLLTDLIEASPKSPRYIVVNGQLKTVPFGPLSLGGILRAVAEPFVRSKSTDDESIESFFRRRFGREVHDRMVAPFVAGIYAGDTEKLSIAATFPRMLEVEREYGSLMTGMLRGKSKKTTSKRRPSRVSSFPQGLEVLPRRMAEGLTIRTNTSGIRIGRDVHPKATVVAAPAFRAAEIFAENNPEIASALSKIEYAPVVVAATSLPLEGLTEPHRGFGFLVAKGERLNMLGTVFNSSLFTDRAPHNRLLLTSFLGGATRPEAFDWPDQRVWDVVCTELKTVLKTTIPPEPIALFRHRRAIPQYAIGHRSRIEVLRNELKRCPGLFIAGNFLDGVSVPACMEQGDATAHAVAEFLGAAS